jgi:hypothetical protein
MRSLLLVMVLGIAVMGCGGPGSADGADNGEEVTEADGIVGSWVVAEVIAGEDIMNTGTNYEFRADGSMESSSGALSIEGTYTLVGDTLRQVIGGVEMDCLYSLDGDELIYDIINGEQTFLLRRQ